MFVRSLGHFELKNVTRPVEVFIVADEDRPVPVLERSPLPTGESAKAVEAPPEQKSIAVLPFVNMSADPDNEFFSDGLTEEIIADLAGIRALTVISRTSAMQFKGTNKNVRSIGRELGAQYVLEGSVRKAGNRLRITAQLIDAHTDAHLWANKYDGSIDDVFDLQERVSREIVGALDVTLTAEEEDGLSDRPISDVRAFELYLKARQELHRYSTEGVADLLSRAVEIEGETPPLRALKAWAKVNQVRTGLNRDNGRWMKRKRRPLNCWRSRQGRTMAMRCSDTSRRSGAICLAPFDTSAWGWPASPATRTPCSTWAFPM